MKLQIVAEVILIFLLIGGTVYAASEFATDSSGTANEVDVLNDQSLVSGTSSSQIVTPTQKEYNGKVGDTETDIGKLIGLESDQIKVKNVNIQKAAGKNAIISAEPGTGYIKLKDKEGNWKEYSGLDKIKGRDASGQLVEITPKIILNAKGEIDEAYFTSVNGGKYEFENERIEVAKGGGIIYKKGKGAQVSVPSKTKINPPVALKANGERMDVSYKSSDSQLELSNGKKISGAIVTYKGDQISFIGETPESEVLIGDMKIRKSADNPQWVKTYLDFKGEVSSSYDSAYLSFNSEKGKVVLGCNIDKRGPAVMFTASNPYGIKLESNDNFAIQALGNSKGSYVSIQNREKEGATALVTTLNQFVINEDGKSLYYNTDTDKMYVRPTSTIIKEFGESAANSGTVPMIVKSYKATTDTTPVETKSGYYLGVSNYNEYGFGKNPDFIKTARYEGYGALYTGISDRLIYNYDLTKEGFEKLTGVPLLLGDSSAQNYVKDPKSIRYLLDIMASSPRAQVNMLGGIYLQNSYWTCAAYATSQDNIIHLATHDGVNAEVMRHEMAHIVDFEDGLTSAQKKSGVSGFRDAWDGRGLDKGPHTYSYGYTDMEDISTFVEVFSYGDQKTISKYLDSSNSHSDMWKARVAVGYYYNYFTKSRMQEIYASAGLPSDDNALKGYLNYKG